jgi:hypothetical protein
MNNQVMIIMGILSVVLLLSNIPTGFRALAEPNPFGQQAIFDSDDKYYNGSARSITNNKMADHNIVLVSTTTSTNDTITTPSRNTNQTIIPMISVVDVINSTYIAPKAIDEEDLERRISRAIRDRINDISHTVVMSNATIISSATITNSFIDESTTTNNYTRLLEIIPDYVGIALAEIRATSQPTEPQIELHTNIETVCIANNTSLAECDINMRLH